jgi:tetratricopeptide (TPR) repeat protein
LEETGFEEPATLPDEERGERMKRTAITMLAAVLGLSAGSLGQTKPAAQTAPAAPAGKRPPQAKTQPEFDAYKNAAAITDPAAQEKAADDFAAKFPDSELRPVIYKGVMRSYQQANNSDKWLATSRKVLMYDPDDPEALLGVSQVLTEKTKDGDPEKEAKLAEARKDAEKSLATVDTDIPASAAPPEQLNQYKGFLRSEAYAILGTLDFNAKQWPSAEANLKKSIDALPQQPDPIAVFRLSVALDMQNKYPDAMKYADQAVDLTKEGTGAGDAARNEKKRLIQLVGGIQ